MQEAERAIGAREGDGPGTIWLCWRIVMEKRTSHLAADGYHIMSVEPAVGP